MASTIDIENQIYNMFRNNFNIFSKEKWIEILKEIFEILEVDNFNEYDEYDDLKCTLNELKEVIEKHGF